MDTLFLDDLKNENDLRSLLIKMGEHEYTSQTNYTDNEVRKEDREWVDGIMDKYDFLIAKAGDDDWCGWCFLLMKELDTKKYYTVYADHCSCHGFEDQFQPTPFNLEKGIDSIRRELKEDQFKLFLDKLNIV